MVVLYSIISLPKEKTKTKKMVVHLKLRYCYSICIDLGREKERECKSLSRSWSACACREKHSKKQTGCRENPVKRCFYNWELDYLAATVHRRFFFFTCIKATSLKGISSVLLLREKMNRINTQGCCSHFADTSLGCSQGT